MESTVCIAAAATTNSPTNPVTMGKARPSLLIPVPGSPRTWRAQLFQFNPCVSLFKRARALHWL
jgi:hypothetical protein